MDSIDISLFNLKPEYFDNQSTLHGINHTYRVMCLTMYIAEAEDLTDKTLPALCAAFIHDLARKDDGYCTQHGSWAAKSKLPAFESLFRKAGIETNDIKIVGKAVANHSVYKEFAETDEAYTVTAILKDADALDRIRLGEDNLDEKYLRFDASRKLVNFAKELYYKTENTHPESFKEIIEIAKQIK
jgi:HD superfamily phosphodiesterase